MSNEVRVEIGGRDLVLETGRVARQADGSVLARYGDTVVLATACMDRRPTMKDFIPLTVDYREYTYSAGKIPGGFFKREGRPSEREVLVSRLTDRPIRPLLPPGWSHETQVMTMVLSADSENDPDIIGLVGASAALSISPIPFNGPIGAVRVGLLEGRLVANPTVAEQKTSRLNIVVAGTEQGIVMVEAGSIEVSEDTIIDAMEFAHAEIRKIVAAIKELQAKVGVEKLPPPVVPFDEELYKRLNGEYRTRLEDYLNTSKYPKRESYVQVEALKAEWMATIPETETEQRKLADRAFETLREDIFREDVLVRRQRPDRRAFDQVRPITCEVGFLPRVPG